MERSIESLSGENIMEEVIEQPTVESTRELVLSLADKNCKHCLGRGYSAIRLDGTPVVCKCIRKNILKRREEKSKL